MDPAPRRATAALLGVLALASPGCLSASYRVAPEELARLARSAPEQRWLAVRATQRLLDSDRPPGTATAVSGSGPVVLVPASVWFRGRTWAVPTGWRRNAPPPRASTSSSTHGGIRTSGASEVVAGLVVAVVVAAGFVFVLAGTEGARYDGWVGVPPEEALYLDNPDGSVTAVPLAALTPALADRANGATLYEGSEARYLRLGRAPLDRVGLTAQSGVVLALVPRSGGAAPVAGIGGRVFVGGYPVRQLGVGASADVLGGVDGSVVALVGAEAQVMPLRWGGLYAGAGWASLAPGDAAGRSGWFTRAGVQLELPITTRLAASLRAGASRLDLGGASVMPEASLGLSVY